MPKAISNTSPLLYLHRIGALDWLPELFNEVWTPDAVVLELKEGKRRGYEVPIPSDYEWLNVVNPSQTPSEWLALDLGAGELATMALALENPVELFFWMMLWRGEPPKPLVLKFGGH